MARPVTLFTGQWADLKLEQMARMTKEFGYDGIELACWGDHFEVDKALADDSYCAAKRELLDSHGLQCHAISAHLVGQAVLDNIDARHKVILPPYVWGDGDPKGINQRALKNSRIRLEPPRSLASSGQWLHRIEYLALELFLPAGFAGDDRRWIQAFGRTIPSDSGCVRRVWRQVCLGSPSNEIAFDIYTAQMALEALGTAKSLVSTSILAT